MNKTTFILCLLLLVAILTAGCGLESSPEVDSLMEHQIGNDEDEEAVLQGAGEDKEEEQFISLYFLNPSGAYLFPLSLSFPQDATTKDLEQHLSSGPMRKEWGKSFIPSGLTIKGIDVVGQRALVNIKTGSTFEFQQYEEELMVKGLVYTLTSLDSVSRVEFLLEGEEPVEPFVLLAQQNLFTRDGLELNPLEPVDSDDQVSLLWFSNQDALYMVPVSLPLEEVPEHTPDLALLLINALIEGPGDSFNLLGSFPEGTEVLSLKIVNQTIEVDFNRSFMANFHGGTAQEWAILNSLVLTLTEIDGIEKVQVLVEGRKEEAALGHMATAQPLIRGVVNWVLVD